MAIHKSLVSKDVLKRQRNVMNRWERIEAMRERETWEEGMSAYGLPKVRVYHHRKRTKVKKEAAEETSTVEAAAGDATEASSNDKKS